MDQQRKNKLKGKTFKKEKLKKEEDRKGLERGKTLQNRILSTQAIAKKGGEAIRKYGKRGRKPKWEGEKWAVDAQDGRRFGRIAN